MQSFHYYLRLKVSVRLPLLILHLIGWAACVGTMFVASKAEAGRGDLVAEYKNIGASAFAMHPKQPYLYAALPNQNAVAIINTNTLVLENMVFVGSGPTNLAVSSDGSTAYFANSTSSFVAVFDTQTRTVTGSFLMPESPRDVVYGSGNRLFVLGTENIFQINASTGASAGPNVGSRIVYGGALEISPDGNTLYYGQYGLSPTTMYKFDVTGATPVLLKQIQTGSNGQDLTLSWDGSFISHPNGAPYLIAKYRTSDFATLGSFSTGAYPREIAFSPDDQVAYAVHTSGHIDVFDTNTFLSLGEITASGEATELAVESTGRYLFATYGDSYYGFTGIRVFDTGRSIGGVISIAQTSNGVMRLQGSGVPGKTYSLQSSSTLTSESFSHRATIIPDSNGLWQYDDDVESAVQRFYRLRLP